MLSKMFNFNALRSLTGSLGNRGNAQSVCKCKHLGTISFMGMVVCLLHFTLYIYSLYNMVLYNFRISRNIITRLRNGVLSSNTGELNLRAKRFLLWVTVISIASRQLYGTHYIVLLSDAYFMTCDTRIWAPLMRKLSAFFFITLCR